MPGLIHGLDPAKIAANLERVREIVGDRAEILAATKYVPLEEMGALAEAGVALVGENRQQDMAVKHERWGGAFEWDFIGNLQSRKIKQLLPICRLIHSVATESVLEQLGRYGSPDTEVLIPRIPLQRLGSPEDVAAAIFYLCAPESAYVTGSEIFVTGGQHLY